MPRISAATKKLKELAAQRSKCFGACNVHAKDVCGICQSYADCLIVTPTLNKGYDPQKPEVEGQNEASYIYPADDINKRIEVEKVVAKLKEKSAPAAKPAREAQPTAKPAREAVKKEEIKETSSEPESPAGEVDDILSEIDGLASDGGSESSETTEDASLDDLGGDEITEPEEKESEPEEEKEPDPVETVTSAAEKVERKKAPAPELTGDMEVALFLIDHFFEKLEGMLMSVMHPNCKSAVAKPKIMADPDEEPVVRKGKPGPKAGAKKKVAKKAVAKGRRKPGPKPGKKKK